MFGADLSEGRERDEVGERGDGFEGDGDRECFCRGEGEKEEEEEVEELRDLREGFLPPKLGEREPERARDDRELDKLPFLERRVVLIAVQLKFGSSVLVVAC